MTQPTTLSASSTNHCNTSYPAITRQDASANAEASSFHYLRLSDHHI